MKWILLVWVFSGDAGGVIHEVGTYQSETNCKQALYDFKEAGARGNLVKHGRDGVCVPMWLDLTGDE